MSKLPKDLMLAAAMLMTIGGAIGYAQDSGRSGRILGHGNNSCDQYLQAVHGHAPGAPRGIKRPEGEYVDEHERYFDWFTGFISATNLWVMGDFAPADAAAVDVWIRRWCEQNPTKLFVEAANAFLMDQRPNSFQEFWKREDFWQQREKK